MLIVTKSNAQIFHNTKVKQYPDGTQKITVASRKVFREKGWEERTDEFSTKVPKPKNMSNESRDDSIRRAKTSIEDIVRLNGFNYFVTLTFDKAHIDRKNIGACNSAVNNFLKNAVSRKGLVYVLVPEYHKDGSIHLHGFFNEALTFIDSGTVKVKGYEKPMKIETAKRKHIPLESCKTVYNIKEWKGGFSTAYCTECDNTQLASYFTKYITKDCKKIFGNYYLAGGEGLVRKAPYELKDIDFSSFEADNESYCEVIDTHFKYKDTAKRKESDEAIDI